MLADNTFFYISSTLSNMERTFKIFDLYCKASGAKLNLYKTKYVWVSRRPRQWVWRIILGLQWLVDKESTQYVGVPVGFNIPQATKDVAPFVFVTKHLNSWSTRHYS